MVETGSTIQKREISCSSAQPAWHTRSVTWLKHFLPKPPVHTAGMARTPRAQVAGGKQVVFSSTAAELQRHVPDLPRQRSPHTLAAQLVLSARQVRVAKQHDTIHAPRHMGTDPRGQHGSTVRGGSARKIREGQACREQDCAVRWDAGNWRLRCCSASALRPCMCSHVRRRPKRTETSPAEHGTL